MEPFSQNFEVLTLLGDVINPELASKRAQTHTWYTNGDRKMKIKSKKNYEVTYLFIELSFQNLEVLAPCWTSSSQNWNKRLKFGDGDASGFCNVQKLTLEMNFFPQILYGYWFWFFSHCWYLMYKPRSFWPNIALMTIRF